jgi:predicted transcriptional regulator
MARPAEEERDPARFVERFGSTLAGLGMPRLPARVFACLLAAEDGRMTSAQLGAALAVSPAAVSGAVRYLQQLRMVHREREPGTRRDIYVVADDAWHDMMVNTNTTYAPLIHILQDGVDLVGGKQTKAGARLALSVEFLDFLVEELATVAERWDARRATHG